MCTKDIKALGLSETFPTDFSPKIEDIWYINGRKIVIDQPLLRYFNKEQDVATKYLSFQFEDGEHCIITHSLFKSSATREEPRVERFVTPRQILNAKPCEDGVIALGKILELKSVDKAWEALDLLYKGQKMNCSYKVSELYNWWGEIGSVPTSWLLFMAQLLNLVPKDSRGPDRETLKRLLGIYDK